MTVNPLPVAALYTPCDPHDLPFTTTEELDDLDEAVGQERAVASVRFGIGIRLDGFNLYCMGSKGTGKASLICQYLHQIASTQPVADDWCYVYNFSDTHRPRALRLPAGRAVSFRRDMGHLVEELRAALPVLFESEEFRTRKQTIDAHPKERYERALVELQERAAAMGVSLMRTQMGLALAPMKEESVLEGNIKILQAELKAVLRQMPQWERESREAVQTLIRELTRYTVDPLVARLKEVHADVPAVGCYLDDVHQNIIDNVGDFIVARDNAAKDSPNTPFPGVSQAAHVAALHRFQVNVIVSRERDDRGAPVVFVDHPTQPNLLGRIEHIQQFGVLMTDFTLIKDGALHLANGGYLILQARKILAQPFAWEDLKRALRAREIRIENPGSAWDFATTTLVPQPIPLSVKVVLLGEPLIYYLLSQYDSDFSELFKVAADFDDRTERTSGNTFAYARLLATLARHEKLRPFHRDAVACIIEHAVRLAEDRDKLSTHMASIADLAREADYWAGENGVDLISRKHVQQAIDARIYRQDRIYASIREEILHGTVLVDTTGAVVGQVNGLSVFQLGTLSFGKPNRITCRVRMGKGEVVDIEREVELGGPLHSKGVLILTSFLTARFAVDAPLSLSATLVFEQSYSGMDGDSASSAELYALLSALAEVPIRQDLAVTGSVNQLGQVQAIGGVNEKIEGFFDICQARGLTGEQGVLIPRANLRHLMLRAEVREAVAAGLFHIYPITHVDEGIALLTGRPAGSQGEDGIYPIGSINRKVAAQLRNFAARTYRLAETIAGRSSRHA